MLVVLKPQIRHNRIFVHTRFVFWMLKQAFYLRAECPHRIFFLPIVEWFDAKKIACDKDRSCHRVINGKSKHPAELEYCSLTLRFIKSQDDLGIGVRHKMHTLFFKVSTELAVVVNLAVKNNNLRPVVRKNRLLSARKVDNE